MRRFLLVLLALAVAAPAHPQPKSTPKPAKSKPAKPTLLVPLTQQERAQQLLSRFTFGPRPGDLEKVIALTPEKWLEQQLNPASIPDAALDRRLADYTTLSLQPDQALQLFPDHFTIAQTAEGKRPYPTDPLLLAMYQVQVYKLNKDIDSKKTSADGKLVTPPTDAEAAAQKKTDQETASRVAGELFALPKNQRMAALIKLPIPERIAFTTYLAGDQKNLLLADFNPREREIFNGMAANIGAPHYIIDELAQAKILRAILSERQLQEVMSDFWFNHFNIFIGKDSDAWYTTSYERDAIRKHALGKFRDLLLATAQTPAMMIYLDNWLSIGPDSLANGINPANPNSKRGNHGLNENYGREVMELHTVGVNGGYTQADVTALSAILTGWTVDRPNQGGPFQYDYKKHEPGPKQWLRRTISSEPVFPNASQAATQAGMKEGIEALTILAGDPHTAHFVSYKLAQRFVADDPPPALVDRMAATYLATDGDIKAILRTLVQSPEFNSKKYFRNKVKTPMEFVASAFRTTATDPVNPGALINTLKTMGMPLYYALPPTGYYITADLWMNSTALVDRLNFAYALTGNKFANQKFDSAHVLALGLMSQPASSSAPEISATERSNRARFSEALLTADIHNSTANQPPPDTAGHDIALHVLEDTLIGNAVSSQTNQLIHKQIGEIPTANSTDTLNLLTALVMGSPEFQLR
ncbi:DUF1800 domain-containing protein [Tunturiibacter empetritectus]|uniref:Uncharacterized protein (DUF1800 family) n=1 Tax=Tunturiibacter lichenicola TaxID=2051959 RepID=A0A852VIE2_9BACT|nr:DUF1800 domain-containing protein [Edaphobacter lichenicola]NYF89272.1 uncharacterized protein (DUF1800 family) [Edaphobacter lichenicola]